MVFNVRYCLSMQGNHRIGLSKYLPEGNYLSNTSSKWLPCDRKAMLHCKLILLRPCQATSFL